MQKIMFNDKYGLTKAVLNKRKTQTRRIVKADNLFESDVIESYTVWEKEIQVIANNGESLITLKPPYKIGEVVAVAQSYKTIDDFYQSAFAYNHSAHGMTICEFDGVSDDDVRKWNMVAVNYRGKKVWTNKFYVKPELMLHFIRITNIRIERLQDISDEDCLAEGIEFNCNAKSYYVDYRKETGYMVWLGPTARKAYAALIDLVTRKAVWDSNPYVYVYEFELVK